MKCEETSCQNLIFAGHFIVNFRHNTGNELSKYFVSICPFNQESTTRKYSIIDNIFPDIPVHYRVIYSFFKHHNHIKIEFLSIKILLIRIFENH